MSEKTFRVMSKKLITIKDTYSLESAYNVMQTHSIRHLPVLNDQAEVVGIISDRDLMRGVHSTVRENRDIRFEDLTFPKNAMVSDYMTWPITVVTESSPLLKTVEMMLENKISSILVVSANDDVVGIVTTDDCMNYLVKLLKEQDSSVVATVETLLLNPIVRAAAHSLSQSGI
jgi:acetoin utilization protein AcuB